ncbi:hypothetical protein JY651_49645 [Pyxidicoccus parkwayensis]|uniref:Uncharacterized protein n=1 Tax=Pyxidicoccus parkwayensis TaxID=2813578 RepID=A0ABX7NX82_9BACT|nr:hypothetical protein [Pyxidicoccus parkwaysis]QSQ23068.1 hypothetical protein JY651_49645 [Pyxidicoccus parkwaysis]
MELPPTDEDLRRKLEGRVERLEAGLGHYRLLDEALADGDWEDRLRDQPALMKKVLKGDAECLEALERVKKRAEVERWPEHMRVLGLASEVSACRTRLEARLRKRLGEVKTVRGEPPLEEALRQLEALVRVPVSMVTEPGESFVLNGGVLGEWKQNLVAAGYCVSMLAILPFCLYAMTQAWGAKQSLWWMVSAVPVLASVLAYAAFRWLSPGSLWLTPRRLVWAPPRSSPIELRLDSIPEGGVTVEERGKVLRVEGDRLMRLRGLERSFSERLQLWLEMLRQPELRERPALVEKPVEMACFRARLRRGTLWESGYAVLMRRMLFFLPEADGGSALVRAATGRTLAFPVELSWVLELLRWQPESDLDAYLLRAVKASRGAAWPSDLARHSSNVPLEQELHFTYGNEVLVGSAPRRELNAIERILASWRRSRGPVVSLPRSGA